jgi:magnesium-transporting ATPase (P-type)
VAIGALFDIIAGLGTLMDVVGSTRAHSVRFLVLAWVVVLAVGLGFWRWMPVLTAAIGNWSVLLVVLWALYALYLISATIASLPERKRRPRSKSRPAS